MAAKSVSKPILRTGRVISALVVLMLLFSASMKFMMPEDAVKGFEHLGWPQRLSLAPGILEASCAIVYAIPQTAVLGAILISAYLGGATATHVRIGDPFFAPPLVGVAVWVALLLREPRLRSLLPLRS